MVKYLMYWYVYLIFDARLCQYTDHKRTVLTAVKCLGADGLLLKIKILMQSLLFSVLAHHKSTVYSAFHHPVYPTSSNWTTTSPPLSIPPSNSLIPSPTTPPPLSNFAFPLDLCVMSWPGLDTIPKTVYRGRSVDVNVILSGITRVINTSGWIQTFSLLQIYTHSCIQTHTITYKESTQIELRFSVFKSYQLKCILKDQNKKRKSGSTDGRGSQWDISLYLMTLCWKGTNTKGEKVREEKSMFFHFGCSLACIWLPVKDNRQL